MPGLKAPSNYSNEPPRHPCLQINSKASLFFFAFDFSFDRDFGCDFVLLLVRICGKDTLFRLYDHCGDDFAPCVANSLIMKI